MIPNNKINLRVRLSHRIGINDIHEIIFHIQANDSLKQTLYELLLDKNDSISYQAAWVFTHFPQQENQWLCNKQNELINELLACSHPGKRRLLLSLLYRQPLAIPPRVDFLDFCLEHMLSKNELPGVKTVAMKLAYELCRPIPELLQEFKSILELQEVEPLPISIRTVRKNILIAMQRGKSLHSY